MSPGAPARRDRVALHLLQLGAVAVVLAAVPYKAFDLDRYFVPKELVLNACAALTALLLVSKRKQLSLTSADMWLAAFLLSSTVSAPLAVKLLAAESAPAGALSGAPPLRG